MGRQYDIEEDTDFGTRQIVEDSANAYRKGKMAYQGGKAAYGAISSLLSNPLFWKILLIVGGIFLVFYLIYLMLFGWSFKVEQSLSEIGESAFDSRNSGYYNEFGYFIYKEINVVGEESYIFCYTRDNEEFELPLEEALKEAYCVDLMMQKKDIDVSTGDALLLDDSDVDVIMDKIIEAEDERKEEVEKRYVWLSKEYDYGTHQEVKTDANGAPVVGLDGKLEYIEVPNDTPEWLPSEEWDLDDMMAWFNDLDTVILRKKDIHGEIDPITNSPRFMVPWQTVVAICEMTSSQGYDNWGNTRDQSMHDFDISGYSDMDGYYLDNVTIQQIVDALSYEFEFHYNGFEEDQWHRTDNHYGWDELENIGYRLEIQEMTDPPAVGDTAFVKKIPEAAPNAISNIYEHYYYHYEDVADGYGKKICTGRSKFTNAVALVNFLTQLAPQFDFDEFIEIVEHFPAAEGEVQKLRKLKGIYEWQMETGEPYFIEEDNLPCFSSGVRLGTGSNEIQGSNLIPPNYAPIFGSNYLEGNFEYVYIDGPKYGGGWHTGWYAVSEAARKDLSTSDGLSRSQIEALLNYLWVRTGSNPDTPFYEATDGIYQWQQSGGGSVTGVLGLWIQEGSLNRAIGLNAWNFSNMVASGSEPYYTSKNGRKWTDFKAMYGGDLGAAMVAQFNRISRNYWNRSGVRQNTFYTMSFLTQGGIYTAQTPDEVCPIEYFTHCYCPFWDDNGFGVMAEKVPNPSYTGWANGCALMREQLYSIAVGS